MPNGTPKRLAGPAYLASSAANIYNPASGNVAGITSIHFANKDSSSRTFTIYLGATGGSAGGTELFPAYPLTAAGTAGAVYTWYPSRELMLTNSDFLTGLASAGSAVTITVMGWLAPTY